MKNHPPSIVAHNWPKIIFFSTGLAAQTARKRKSRTTKSPLMQDWVFRLGLRVVILREQKIALEAKRQAILTKMNKKL